jgi:hypothetical protein
MALSEFVAIETAYRALQQLDDAGRRRALRWLNDALEVPAMLPEVQTTPTAALPGAALVATDLSTARARSRRRPAKQTAAANERPAKATRTRGATTTAPARQARRSRQRQAAPTKAQARDQRAYRRMPPAEDVLAAYRQAGTLTGLAEHYGVPRHTIQGWARRLRSQGHAIGRSA